MRWPILKCIAVSSVVCWLVVGRGGPEGSAGMDMPQRLTGYGEVSLPYTSIAQGAASGGEGTTPALQLVCTEAQRATLAARLSAIARPALAAVDLSTSIVIAAFQGLQPTSGYRIDICAVEVSTHGLDVIVKRSSPSPGEPVRPGFTSPYHLVQVSRDVFDVHHPTSYRLRDAACDALKAEPIDTISQGSINGCGPLRHQ
jgi:PrcB C-terminal